MDRMVMGAEVGPSRPVGHRAGHNGFDHGRPPHEAEGEVALGDWTDLLGAVKEVDHREGDEHGGLLARDAGGSHTRGRRFDECEHSRGR